MARTVFTHANVLDGEHAGTARHDRRRGGQPHRLGRPAASSREPDDVVYDLRGKTLMPGLGTGHLHAEFHHIDMGLLTHVYDGAERPAGVLMAVAINTCRKLLESGLHDGGRARRAATTSTPA